MVLTELQIATVIVTATYIALIGALALGTALAFGLGGRDAAADMINTGYRKAQQQHGQSRPSDPADTSQQARERIVPEQEQRRSNATSTER